MLQFQYLLQLAEVSQVTLAVHSFEDFQIGLKFPTVAKWRNVAISGLEEDDLPGAFGCRIVEEDYL